MHEEGRSARRKQHKFSEHIIAVRTRGSSQSDSYLVGCSCDRALGPMLVRGPGFAAADSGHPCDRGGGRQGRRGDERQEGRRQGAQRGRLSDGGGAEVACSPKSHAWCRLRCLETGKVATTGRQDARLRGVSSCVKALPEPGHPRKREDRQSCGRAISRVLVPSLQFQSLDSKPVIR